MREGTDVDIKDRYGQTAVFFAAANNNEEIVRFLLQKGSDVNVQDNDGRTPLYTSAANGKFTFDDYKLLEYNLKGRL